MKKVLGLILLLVLLLGAFSCKKKEESVVEGDVFFEVTFVTTDLPSAVTPPAAVKVKAGEAVSCPSLDVEVTAGYVLIWTKSRTSKNAYDFASPVEEDLTLFAVEVPRTYTVTYLIEHGKNVKANPTSFTKESETLTLKAPYMDTGYKFLRWAPYNDPDSTVDAIETGTEGDVVLRAVVEPIEYVVHYLSAGDANPNPTTYLFGTTVTLEAPSKEGYVFRGYTIAEDAAKTPVTVLDPEFVAANLSKLTYRNGIDIWLQTNWEKVE